MPPVLARIDENRSFAVLRMTGGIGFLDTTSATHRIDRRDVAERRLADDAEALGFREVGAFGGRSQRGIQRPGELNVERVPRLAGADMAGKRAAQEREVSDEVQDLVPHELVAEAQGPGNDAALVE